MQPTIDADLLLRHSGWMRALAYELLRDSQGAEDVVQEAWLAALRRPPREGSHLTGWLARVVRNRASTHKRGEARRRHRERMAARPESLPGAEEALEGLALQRTVVDEVFRLPSPEREILVLRYFEGLPPRTIAGRLELSGSAVRSRLSRALTILRSRLDATHAGERRNWSVALAAWVAKPETLMGLAHAKLWVGAAVAAVVLLVSQRFFVPGTQVPQTPKLLESPLTQGATLDAPLDEDPELENGVHDEVRAAVLSVPDRTAPTTSSTETATLIARIVDPSGQPVSEVRCEVRGDEEGARRSDATGHVSLSLAWPPDRTGGDAYVDLTGEGITGRWIRTPVPRPDEFHLGDIVVEPGGRIRGRVIDAGGRPVSQAQVFAGELPAASRFDEVQRRMHGVVTLGNSGARTDAEGWYELSGIPARLVCVFGRVQGGFYGFGPEVTVRAGERVTAPNLVLEPAAEDEHLFGIVLDHEGRPLPNTRLSAARADHVRLGGAHFSDDNGRFRILAPRATDHRLAAAHGEHGEYILSPAPTGQPLEIRFPEPRWIDLEVQGSGDRPLHGLQAHSSVRDNYGQLTKAEEVGEGRLRLRVPRVAFEVRVDATGYRAVSLGPFEVDQAPERLEVQLEPASGVGGRLLVEGVPLARARVHAHALWEKEPGIFEVHSQTGRAAESDAEGRFFLEIPQAGRHTLHAEHAGQCRAHLGEVDVVSSAVVELGEVAWSQGGSLLGEVDIPTDPSGRMVVAWAGDGHLERLRLGPEGTFRLDSLTPGVWSVALLALRPGMLEHLPTANARLLEDIPPDRIREVTVPAAGEAWVRLDLDRMEETTIVSGVLRIGSKSSPFTSLVLRSSQERVPTTVDGEGRFSVRIQGRGELRIDSTAFYSRGVRVKLWAILEQSPPSTRWMLDAATGSLELTGLGPARDPEDSPDFRSLRMSLLRSADDLGGGAQFLVEITHSVSESLLLEDLPVGDYVLRRAGESDQELRVTAGGTSTFDLGN